MSLRELIKLHGVSKIALTLNTTESYVYALRCGQRAIRGIHLFLLKNRFPELDLWVTISSNIRLHNKARIRQGKPTIL